MPLPNMIGRFQTPYGLANVSVARYIVGGHPCIHLDDAVTGEPIAKLSTNLPREHLAEGEFHVKTWGENADLIEPALASGLFEDTGRSIPVGFGRAAVWRIKT